MKPLLIIPAYNEEECIEHVVRSVVGAGYDYVVVNDGSTDGTASVCEENGFRYLDLPVNLGLAGAFQAGVRYADAQGYDCVIQFDADGQHDVRYVADLVNLMGECDIAIGSRYVDADKPHSLRMLGSNIIGLMILITTHKRMSDPTSGMRAYGPRAIGELKKGPNLGPEPDTIAYLMLKRGLTVKETQVQMGERMAGESYLNFRKSIAYMLRMTLSVLVVQFFR